MFKFLQKNPALLLPSRHRDQKSPDKTNQKTVETKHNHLHLHQTLETNFPHNPSTFQVQITATTKRNWENRTIPSDLSPESKKTSLGSRGDEFLGFLRDFPLPFLDHTLCVSFEVTNKKGKINLNGVKFPIYFII